MAIFIQKLFLQTKSMNEFSDMKSKNVTNDQNAPTDSELETHIYSKLIWVNLFGTLSCSKDTCRNFKFISVICSKWFFI